MNMVGHYYISEDLEASGLPRFVKRFAHYILQLFGTENWDSIVSDGR